MKERFLNHFPPRKAGISQRFTVSESQRKEFRWGGGNEERRKDEGDSRR